MPLQLGKVSVFYLKRQMILTYFNEIFEKPAETGSTCPDLKMFGNQWNIPEILVCSFSPNKCNECQSVDANLDPDDTFGSPQFCSIDCSTGLRFAQYCILNCRQPDKYGRKGNFKNQRNESLPFQHLSKEEPLRLLQADPHQWSSGRNISWLTVLSEMTTHWWCSADIFWVCRQALWWTALPKL